MKLDTKLQTQYDTSETLVKVTIFGKSPIVRTYSDFGRAMEWAQFKTNRHGCFHVCHNTASDARSEPAWTIKPVIVHS